MLQGEIKEIKDNQVKMQQKYNERMHELESKEAALARVMTVLPVRFGHGCDQ